MALIPTAPAGTTYPPARRAWLAFGLGLLAAGLHLPVSYALVKWTCAAGNRTPLLLLALAAGLVAAAGAALAWSCERRHRGDGDDDEGPAGQGLFIARVALGTNLLLTLFAAVSVVGPLVLSPCA